MNYRQVTQIITEKITDNRDLSHHEQKILQQETIIAIKLPRIHETKIPLHSLVSNRMTKIVKEYE